MTHRNAARRTQHKETREDRKTKTLEEMTAECKRLRKQLAHANKTISRLQNMIGSAPEEDTVEEKQEVKSDQCCSNSNVISLPLRSGGVLSACKNCNFRKVEK